MALPPRRYVAFDLDIARELPPDARDLLAYRPLGICCAATYMLGETGPRLWHGKDASGQFTTHMTAPELHLLVDYLIGCVSHGCAIVTWNGLAFDFDILAEESGRTKDCQHLAWNHVDMMYHLFCLQGYRLTFLARANKLITAIREIGFRPIIDFSRFSLRTE